MVYRYSYVLNNPTRYTDPTGNAYNGGTWSYGAGATFAANYNNHTAEYAAWEQFFNAEKADMMRELMPQSGGGTSIAEVNMGDGYTPIGDNSSSAFVQNYYAFRAGLIRYRYEHIISGTYLLPEVVIYVKRSAQGGGGSSDKDIYLDIAGVVVSGMELSYLNDAKQVLKSGQRIDGKVRSAETLTRANRISSTATAKYLGYVGKALGIYGAYDAGTKLLNDPSNPANWVKFGASTGMLFMKANPFTFFVGVGYTVLDQGGYIDDWIGN